MIPTPDSDQAGWPGGWLAFLVLPVKSCVDLSGIALPNKLDIVSQDNKPALG
jgi:hypothetical protein